MNELVVFGFLALSIFAYGVTGGADFGVGILETVLPRDQRVRVRHLGEHAIAPVWEANHIWLIVALVICFVGYPGVHVYLTTFLHVPLLLMLVGIILRGTAFTFRYYDVGDQATDSGIWTPVFRLGSLLVPFAFGLIAASLRSGQMPAEATTVWATYFTPWLAPFPLLTGLFGISICAWLAAVFLVGECEPEEQRLWARRSRRATVVMVITGGMATIAGLTTPGAGAERAFTDPFALTCVGASMVGVLVLWRLVGGHRYWTQRLLAGAIFGTILMGYFGVDVSTAVLLDDGTRIQWHLEAAPWATMQALMVTLFGASLLILPGLAWLYRLFKLPRDTV